MFPSAHSFTYNNIDFTNCCDVESKILWKENINSVLKIKSSLLIHSNDFSSYILSLSLFDNGEKTSFGEKIFDLDVLD
jgi:hypothetical protein